MGVRWGQLGVSWGSVRDICNVLATFAGFYPKPSPKPWFWAETKARNGCGILKTGAEGVDNPSHR